jgi:hypothetical protein
MLMEAIGLLEPLEACAGKKADVTAFLKSAKVECEVRANWKLKGI